jgi:hypothetical protein
MTSSFPRTSLARALHVSLALAALVVGFALSPQSTASAQGKRAPVVGPDEARSIAKLAYIYSFSMIESYNTMFKQVGTPSAPEYVGGFGKLRHYSTPFTSKNHDIVTPNNDTPYSWAWLDLRAEPWVFRVPAVADERYYVAQWMDLFPFNFAYVGSRATGNGPGDYLFVGPGWKGEIPAGVKQVFRPETQIVVMLMRVALDGAQDVPNVKAVQAGFELLPLSSYTKSAPPPSAPAVAFPAFDRAAARTHDFIKYFNFLLQFYPKVHASEVALMARFAKIGIGAGKAFEPDKLEPALLAAIEAGVKDAQETLKQRADKTLGSNGLFGSRQFLKTDYLTRAVAAEKGLYGNSIEEAWYGGYLGNGQVPSQIHFSKAELPPARFFWSITLYTLPERFLYDNPLNRYSIGDRSKGLVYDADGGLTIYVSHVSPGKERESNWLPAPAAPCSLVARLYGPSKAAQAGKWKLPALTPTQ